MISKQEYSTSSARDGVSEGRVRSMGANDGSEAAMTGDGGGWRERTGRKSGGQRGPATFDLLIPRTSDARPAR